MRPRGSYGEIGKALCKQARMAPGTVAELAVRAQVGVSCARYTATRLVQAGELMPLNPGERPQVLGAGSHRANDLVTDDAVVILSRCFWVSGHGA